MYPAAFLRKPRDLTPIDRLATHGATAHPQSAASFWHALRALPDDVIDNVVDQGMQTKDAALIWSTLHRCSDAHQELARDAAILKRLNMAERTNVLTRIDPAHARYVHQRLHPQLIRDMDAESDPLARLRISSVAHSVRVAANKSHFSVRYPDNMQAIISRYVELSPSVLRRLQTENKADAALVELSDRFTPGKVAVDENTTFGSEIARTSYSSRVRALSNFCDRSSIREERPGGSSFRYFSRFHANLIDSVLSGVEEEAFSQKVAALDVLVRQRYGAVAQLVHHPVARDAIGDVTQHLAVLFSSGDARIHTRQSVALAETVFRSPIFGKQPPESLMTFVRGLSELERGQMIERLVDRPDVDLKNVRTLVEQMDLQFAGGVLSHPLRAKLRALDLLYSFDQVPLVANRENAIRTFRQSVKYKRQLQLDPSEIGRVMTVVSNVAKQRILAIPLVSEAAIPKVHYDRQIAPFSWLDEFWQHADEHQQRGIMIDMLPYLADAGNAGDAALSRWKARLDQVATQPYHDERRPVSIDGTAFVRAIRIECKRMREMSEAPQYSALLKVALDALTTADDRTKYMALSLMAADASQWKCALFTHALAERVIEDPSFGAEAGMPHLIRRLKHGHLSSTVRATLIRLSEVNLEREDLLAALACIASTVRISTAEQADVSGIFVQASKALRHADHQRIAVAGGAAAGTVDELLDARETLRAVMPVRFANLPVEMQDEAAQFLPRTHLRASDIVNMVGDGKIPRTLREATVRKIVTEYPNMSPRDRARVAEAILRELPSLPAHHFPKLCEYVMHRLTYADLAQVASHITEWHDPRIPYLMSKIEAKVGEQQLALELLRVANILPPPAISRLWRSVAIEWPEIEAAEVLRYSDILAENLQYVPIDMERQVHDRVLKMLTTSLPLQESVPQRARLTNALFTRIDKLSHDERITLVKHAMTVFPSIEPKFQLLIGRIIEDEMTDSAMHIALQKALKPSFVEQSCLRTLRESNAGIEEIALVETLLQPLEARFAELKADRAMMPVLPLPQEVHAAFLQQQLELSHRYAHSSAAVLHSIEKIAVPAARALAIARFARILPGFDLELEHQELREMVVRQHPSDLRDVMITELDALRGSADAAMALADLFSQHFEDGNDGALWRAQVRISSLANRQATATEPAATVRSSTPERTAELIELRLGAVQEFDTDANSVRVLRHAEDAHRMGDGEATTLLASAYALIRPIMPEIAERYTNLAGLLVQNPHVRARLSQAPTFIPSERIATQNLLRAQRDLIQEYDLGGAL